MVISSDRIRSPSLWRLAWFEMGWEDGIADPEKHGATTPFGRWLQLQMMNSIMSDIWCLHVLQLHLVNLVYDSIWDWSFRSILYIPYHTMLFGGRKTTIFSAQFLHSPEDDDPFGPQVRPERSWVCCQHCLTGSSTADLGMVTLAKNHMILQATRINHQVHFQLFILHRLKRLKRETIC